jgi:hypothetical protein
MSWRRENIRAILGLLDNNETKARQILATAIAKMAGGDISMHSDRIRRVVKETMYPTDERVELIESGCRDLVAQKILPEKYSRSGILDERFEPPGIVYLHASVSAEAWNLISETLAKIPEVCEASLVYGSSDFDAIIKIEASLERVNEIMMQAINVDPYIHGTQTLQAVSYSHWQREQSKRDYDTKMFDVDDIGGGLTGDEQDYVNLSFLGLVERTSAYPKLRKLFSRERKNKWKDLRELANGTVTLKRTDTLNTYLETVAEAAKHQIRAVVVVDQIGEGEGSAILRYLDAQAERIKQGNGNFHVRRIFIVDNAKVLKKDEAIQGRIGVELSRGIEVKFLVASKWPKARRRSEPNDFGIMDAQAYWEVLNQLNDAEMRMVKLTMDKSVIDQYCEDFDSLWLSATSLSKELVKQCKAASSGFELLCRDDL